MRALILIACVAACGDEDGPAVGPDARDTVEGNQGMDMPAVPPGCATGRSLVDRPDDNGFDQIRFGMSILASAIRVTELSS